MENSNETIGNRTRDLRRHCACSAVPQPTAPHMLAINTLSVRCSGVTVCVIPKTTCVILPLATKRFLTLLFFLVIVRSRVMVDMPLLHHDSAMSLSTSYRLVQEFSCFRYHGNQSAACPSHRCYRKSFSVHPDRTLSDTVPSRLLRCFSGEAGSTITC